MELLFQLTIIKNLNENLKNHILEKIILYNYYI